MKIINRSSSEIVVEVGVEVATTNLNGTVEYGKSMTKLDKVVPYNTSQGKKQSV